MFRVFLVGEKNYKTAVVHVAFESAVGIEWRRPYGVGGGGYIIPVRRRRVHV